MFWNWKGSFGSRSIDELFPEETIKTTITTTIIIKLLEARKDKYSWKDFIDEPYEYLLEKYWITEEELYKHIAWLSKEVSEHKVDFKKLDLESINFENMNDLEEVYNFLLNLISHLNLTKKVEYDNKWSGAIIDRITKKLWYYKQFLPDISDSNFDKLVENQEWEKYDEKIKKANEKLLKIFDKDNESSNIKDKINMLFSYIAYYTYDYPITNTGNREVIEKATEYLGDVIAKKKRDKIDL